MLVIIQWNEKGELQLKKQFAGLANSRVSVDFDMLKWASGLGAIAIVWWYNVSRSIFPEKAYSGSIDGSRYGAGMYRIHGEMYGNPRNMSGFFTSYGYWEGGIVFYFISTAIAAIYTLILLGCGYSLKKQTYCFYHCIYYVVEMQNYRYQIVTQSITIMMSYVFLLIYEKKWKI